MTNRVNTKRSNTRKTARTIRTKITENALRICQQWKRRIKLFAVTENLTVHRFYATPTFISSVPLHLADFMTTLWGVCCDRYVVNFLFGGHWQEQQQFEIDVINWISLYYNEPNISFDAKVRRWTKYICFSGSLLYFT